MTTLKTLEDITLTAISQTEKDKFCMISLVCGIEKNRTCSNREKNAGNRGLEGGGGGEADQGGKPSSIDEYAPETS